MNWKTLGLVAIGTLAFCSPVAAHPFHSHTNGTGIVEGFSHPWFGLDHLLAMVAVGLLSTRLGGKAIWALPLSFLAAMTAGGLAGMTGLNQHLIETAIGLSVVFLGIAMASGRKLPLAVASVGVACIGLFHGFAHCAEMPSMANPAFFVTGFIAATANLHLVGIAAGQWLTHCQRDTVALRYCGVSCSLAGAGILLGVL